eukprot:116921-Prorocentrum_minimum.AAC.1
MWGTSRTWETWGILQILRTRFLELVTPHMLAKRSRAPTDTLPSETRYTQTLQSTTQPGTTPQAGRSCTSSRGEDWADSPY